MPAVVRLAWFWKERSRGPPIAVAHLDRRSCCRSWPRGHWCVDCGQRTTWAAPGQTNRDPSPPSASERTANRRGRRKPFQPFYAPNILHPHVRSRRLEKKKAKACRHCKLRALDSGLVQSMFVPRSSFLLEGWSYGRPSGGT